MEDIDCGRCLKVIEGREYLRCSVCKQTFDLECANVSEKRFYNTMTTVHRSAWKCIKCKEAKPVDTESKPASSSNTPLSSVTTRRGGSVRTPYGQGGEEVTDDDLIDDNKQLILEMRRFREEVRLCTHQMEAFNLVMLNLTARVDACESRMDQLVSRVETLEKQATEKSSSEGASSNAKLLSSIEQLKAELNERDQELLLNDVQISCITEQKTENLNHIAVTLANKLGMKLTEQDIVSCARVGRAPEPVESSASPPPRPRLIVVRLARRALRDELLQAARVRRGATTEDTGLPGPPRRFYINERLTRDNRMLFNRARELGGRLNWRFVWTRDGRVFVRQHQGQDAPRHRLRTEADLVKVFGPDAVCSYYP